MMKGSVTADATLDLLLTLIHFLYSDEEEPAETVHPARKEVTTWIYPRLQQADLSEFVRCVESFEGKDLIIAYLQDHTPQLQPILDSLARVDSLLDWQRTWSEQIQPTYAEQLAVIQSWLSDSRFEKLQGRCRDARIVVTPFLPAPPAGQVGVHETHGDSVSVSLCFGVPGAEGFQSHGMDALWLFRGVTHYLVRAWVETGLLNLDDLHRQAEQQWSDHMRDSVYHGNLRFLDLLINRVVQAYCFEGTEEDDIVFAYLRGGGYLLSRFLIQQMRLLEPPVSLELALRKAFQTLADRWDSVWEVERAFDDPIFACFLTHWHDRSLLVLPAPWRERTQERLFIKSLMRYASLLQKTTYQVRYDDEVHTTDLEHHSVWIVSFGEENRWLPADTKHRVERYRAEACRAFEQTEWDGPFQTTFLAGVDADKSKWKLVTVANSLEALYSLLNLSPTLMSKSLAMAGSKLLLIDEWS